MQHGMPYPLAHGFITSISQTLPAQTMVAVFVSFFLAENCVP